MHREIASRLATCRTAAPALSPAETTLSLSKNRTLPASIYSDGQTGAPESAAEGGLAVSRLSACALLGLALVPAAASASPAFNEAADQLLAHGYPQGIADELGKIARLWNVMPQYRMIEAGRFAEARAGLLPMRDVALADLNARVAGICAVLERVTPKVDGLH